ncbi:MAG: hypothetical protein ABW121_05560 [Candidatus Thiodiazotropha sp. 6PLUC7]
MSDATTDIGALFNQDDLFPRFGSFNSSCHAADAATDHENSLIGCDYFRHGLSSVAEWLYEKWLTADPPYPISQLVIQDHATRASDQDSGSDTIRVFFYCFYIPAGHIPSNFRMS